MTTGSNCSLNKFTNWAILACTLQVITNSYCAGGCNIRQKLYTLEGQIYYHITVKQLMQHNIWTFLCILNTKLLIEIDKQLSSIIIWILDTNLIAQIHRFVFFFLPTKHSSTNIAFDKAWTLDLCKGNEVDTVEQYTCLCVCAHTHT